MGVQDVAFLFSQASFPPRFLKVAIKLKASGPLHVVGIVTTTTVVGVGK